MENLKVNIVGRLIPVCRPTSVIRSLGLLVAAVLLPVATAQAAVYSFNFNPPVKATDNAGETIRLAGAGTFDTTLGAVLAAGAYSISNSGGKKIEHGTWAATGFVDFQALGGPNPGVQGGVLNITITLFPEGGAPVENVPMKIVCPFEDGAFDEGDDAATVGNFTTPAGGLIVFHLLKP